MTPSTERDWTRQLKQVLKSWHQVVALGENPLVHLRIVENRRRRKGYSDDVRGRARALRDVIRQGIQALAVPDEPPPDTETDPAWLNRAWRPYSILTLRYLRGLPRLTVQQRIGLAEGGQFYRDQRQAIATLATLLRDWEGDPEGESSPLAIAYPSGAVRLSDTFYIARKADADLDHEIRKPGRTITITGPRQVGKTSLLIRGIQAGIRAHQAKVVYIDLQAVSQTSLNDGDRFLRQFAYWLVDELDLDGDEVERAWGSRLGALRKLTKLLDGYVLPAAGSAIILALDEIDRLLLTSFHADFFSLLRSWHNLRARSPQWERFNLLMAISTEPYLLIDDLRQSPFNVGLMLYLSDFNTDEVEELNRRYGSPLTAAELPQLMQLVNGHPYLTRVALYTLVKEQMSLPDLIAVATGKQGPFISHLRYQRGLLVGDSALREAMKQILANGHCPDDMVRYRLLKAGLIKRDGAAVVCRCRLYRRYFAQEL